MTKMKKTFILLFSLFLAFSTYAETKKEIKAYETAVLLMNEGKYKEAIPILKDLIRNNKEYIAPSWTLADLYGRMNNDEKKIATLIYIAKPNMPNYAATLLRLGKAYHETCNYEKALETYKTISPSDATFYKRAQIGIKQCEDALEFVAKPVPFHYKKPTHGNQGEIRRRSGKSRDAQKLERKKREIKKGNRNLRRIG